MWKLIIAALIVFALIKIYPTLNLNFDTTKMTKQSAETEMRGEKTIFKVSQTRASQEKAVQEALDMH